MNRTRIAWSRVVLVVVILIAAGYVFSRYAQEREKRIYALNAADGKVAWSAPIDLNWSDYSRLSSDDERVYLATSDIRDTGFDKRHWQIAAYDNATGQRAWTYAPFGTEGNENICLSTVSSGPMVANGIVYAWVCAGPDGDGSTTFDKAAIVALDASTGKVLWEFESPETPRVMALGSPLPLRVIGDSAYVLAWNAQKRWSLSVLDTKTGKATRVIPLPALADKEPPDLPVSAMQADAQTIYLNVSQIMAINPANGDLWFAINAAQTPWLADREGIFGDVRSDGVESLVSYSPVDGSVLWQQTIDGKVLPNVSSDPNIDLSLQMGADSANAYVYGSDLNNRQVWMVALRRSDGAVAWIKSLEDQDLFSDILMRPSGNGQIVTYQDGDGLFAADAASGKVLWTFHQQYRDVSQLVDSQRVYLLDDAPRYRYWLAALNPAWH